MYGFLLNIRIVAKPTFLLEVNDNPGNYREGHSELIF